MFSTPLSVHLFLYSLFSLSLFLFIFMTKTNHGCGFHNQNGSSHRNFVESEALSLICNSF